VPSGLLAPARVGFELTLDDLLLDSTGLVFVAMWVWLEDPHQAVWEETRKMLGKANYEERRGRHDRLDKL
jgi:hypothetical protein